MKNLFVGLAVLFLIGILLGLYLYNKPHKSIVKADTELTITAKQLFGDYSTDETTANDKFLDKIIEVQGVIKEINRGQNPDMLLESGNETFGVLCSFDNPVSKNLEEGDMVVVKGLCTGMLTDVVLIKCSIKENKD